MPLMHVEILRLLAMRVFSQGGLESEFLVVKSFQRAENFLTVSEIFLA